ncbi:MAG: hypothetical protein KA155_08405 [Alphaproteobacteria bacterium]|jgi:molybdopterin converting factor small subunit|nr:hypothetical protein [Alphaproteobacteria bacterium]
MKEIAIHIKLFGAFRKFGEALNFSVPSGSSGAAIKKAISGLLKGNEAALVFDSVLANDNAILPDSHIFESDSRLSILPPVCGG